MTLEDPERFKESQVPCSVFSGLTRHYRRRLYYIGKERLHKVINAGVPIIVTMLKNV